QSHRALSEHKTLSISWSHYRRSEIFAGTETLTETIKCLSNVSGRDRTLMIECLHQLALSPIKVTPLGWSLTMILVVSLQ
ncbi:TPA: hypothetical protein ACTYR0_006595, partial [Klebsiella michiganensis]